VNSWVYQTQNVSILKDNNLEGNINEIT